MTDYAHRPQNQPKRGLTPARSGVLEFVIRFQTERGYAPTVREIGAERRLAPSTVHGILDRLEREGYIERPHTGSQQGARAIVVKKSAAE